MIASLPHIARMQPYALARMKPPEGKALVSLSQNESLRAPSPMAVEAAARAMHDAALYPDPDWIELREALSDLHAICADNILCGSGSLDLIGCLARVFAAPDRAVLAPAHAYPFFRTAAQMVGARFDTAPEDETTFSVDALLNALQPDTALAFVANPGNPTGTRVPQSELRRLRKTLPESVLLIIDEAYAEFADSEGEALFDMVEQGGTVILRTFSKAYGLAGCRVGWGVFPPEVAGELRKVINPNNVTAPAQAAALAALGDQGYMHETCTLTSELREVMAARLRQAGFCVRPSFTNFLLIELKDAEAAMRAEAALQDEGIFLRPQGGAGLPHALRMTIGPVGATNDAVSLLECWKLEGE